MGSSDDELKEMQDPNSWEFPVDAPAPPRGQRARAIVSVAFRRDDFTRVHDAAASRGMTLSEFIREAALSEVQNNVQAAPRAQVTVGSQGQIAAYFVEIPQSTGGGQRSSKTWVA